MAQGQHTGIDSAICCTVLCGANRRLKKMDSALGAAQGW
jgi:hypothetical protein